MNRFTYHRPDQATVIRHQAVRTIFLAVATFVEGVIPLSPERAAALMKLEEAMFWVHAGVARIDPASRLRR